MTDDQSPQLGGDHTHLTQTEPRLGGEAAIAHLLEALNSEDALARERAIIALTKIGSDEALGILLTALQDDNTAVVQRAIRALGDLGDPRALDALMPMWRDPVHRPHRTLIAEAFGRIGDPRALPLLGSAFRMDAATWAIARIAAGDPAAQPQAARTFLTKTELAHLTPQHVASIGEWLIAQAVTLLNDPDEAITLRAAYLLMTSGSPAQREEAAAFMLMWLAEGSDALLTQDSLLLGALAQAAPEETVDALVTLMEEGAVKTRYNAEAALLTALEALGFELSPPMQQRLTAIVPRLASFANKPHNPYADRSAYLLRLIGTPAAHDAADTLVQRRVERVLAPFLEANTPTSDEVFVTTFDHNLLQRMLNAPAVLGYTAHPLMQEHAFPMIAAWLDATGPQGAFSDPDGQQFTLVEALGRLGDERAVPTLLDLLRQRPRLTDPALEALGMLAHPDAIPALTTYLVGYDAYTRELAIDALVNIGLAHGGDDRIVPALAPLLAAPDEGRHRGRSMRYYVTIALGQLGDAAAVPHLAALLHDDDAHMVSLVATALGLIAQALPADHPALPTIRGDLTPHLADVRYTRHRNAFGIEDRTLGDHIQAVLQAIN